MFVHSWMLPFILNTWCVICPDFHRNFWFFSAAELTREWWWTAPHQVMSRKMWPLSRSLRRCALSMALNISQLMVCILSTPTTSRTNDELKMFIFGTCYSYTDFSMLSSLKLMISQFQFLFFIVGPLVKASLAQLVTALWLHHEPRVAHQCGRCELKSNSCRHPLCL